MKTIQPLLFLGLLPIALLAEKKAALPKGIPVGYKLVYSRNFEGNEAKEKSQFWFTTPDNWQVPAERGKSFIESGLLLRSPPFQAPGEDAGGEGIFQILLDSLESFLITRKQGWVEKDRSRNFTLVAFEGSSGIGD